MLKTAAVAVSVALAAVDFSAFHLLPFGFVIHNFLALLVGGGLLACAAAIWRREEGVWQAAALAIGGAMLVLHSWKLVNGPLQANCVGSESTLGALLSFLLRR